MTSATTSLALPSKLEIRDVESLHRDLTEALRKGEPMRLEVGALDGIDTAAVQLLLAFRRAAARRGLSLEIVGRSRALDEALRLLGLGAAWGAS